MRRHNWGVAVVAVLIACLAVPFTVNAQGDKEAMLKHLEEGIKQFESGNYDKACAELTELLKLQPDSQTALELIEKIQEEKVLKMLSSEKTRAQAVRLLKLAEQETIRRKADPEHIKKNVIKLSGEFETRWEGINELVRIGDYSVPYLLPLLDVEKQTDQSAFAMLTLKKIGWKAVLPLIEALNSEKRFLKQNVCMVLGQIGDARALPALKAICENEKELPEVRNAAAKAIEAITGKPAATLKPAAQLYYDLAMRYYTEDITVMRFVTPKMLVWRWCAKCPDICSKLKYYEEPRYAYSKLQTEEACLDGLAVDPNYEPLHELLVLNYCSLIGLTRALLSGQVVAGKLPEKLSDEEKKELEERMKKLERWINNARAGGSKYLSAALRRALAAGDCITALECIRALDDLRDRRPAEPPKPLIDALACPDKAVRYAAAVTLLHISPDGRLSDPFLTVRVLSQALSEKAKRTVLIMIDDLQQRNRIKGILAQLPYQILEAEDEQEATRKIKLGLPPVDIILLSDGFAKMNTVTYARGLRRSAEAVNIAVIVLTKEDKIDAVREKYGEGAFCVLPIAVEKDVLASKLEAAVKRPEVTLDDTAQTQKAIIAAADAVASLEHGKTNYPINKLAPCLTQLLDGYEDCVRIAALRALATVGDNSTLSDVLKVARNAQNSKEVRVAALNAAGEILQWANELRPAECDCLIALLDDPCAEVATAAAVAIGKFAPPATLVTRIVEGHRLQLGPYAAPAAPEAAPAEKAGAPAPMMPETVKALMMMMKQNSTAMAEDMKAGNWEGVAMKAKMLAKGAMMGKEKFSMGNNMVAAQYAALAAAADAMSKAASEKNMQALQAASQQAMGACMKCHQMMRK